MCVALPLHRGEALGVLAQRDRVGAVVAVDGDAAAERDVADDRVAGHRAAALGQAQHDVVDALDADAVVRRRAGRLAARAAAGLSSVSAGVSSSSAASPCLRRCITLLTTTLGEILAPPSAM